MNPKVKILEKALNGLEGWLFTGWRIKVDDTYDNKDIGGWECVWKKPIVPIENVFEKASDLPSDKCGCCTKIKWNYLIVRNNEEYYCVGSECINLFTNKVKHCVECKEVNRCHTPYCSECRIKCFIHNCYHDDNHVCEEQRSKQPKVFKIIPFGKYKGSTIEDIYKTDVAYIRWMYQLEDLSDALRLGIKTVLHH
jgi:hypothetical protein